MSKIKERQAAHLKQFLDEQGLSQKALGDKLGISTTSINRWTKGKQRMSETNAEEIHNLWPDYSIEWLLGTAVEKNPAKQAFRDAMDVYGRYAAIDDSILCLVRESGFAVKDVVSDMTIQLPNEQEIDALDYIIRTHDRELNLTGNQWEQFKDEIMAYVQMRIDLMLKRGQW